MQEERCPLCLRIKHYDIANKTYYRFQNTERLVCEPCAKEVENRLRPTWQIVAGRVFPRSTKND